MYLTYDLSQLSIDHVHPRSRGGQDVASNAVCACTRCNQEKGSTNWLSYMRATFGVNRLREKLIMEYIN
jgi:CRISPR/Cas system Type II protein with McrA/HNH and RuvC-like nuclease domain